MYTITRQQKTKHFIITDGDGNVSFSDPNKTDKFVYIAEALGNDKIRDLNNTCRWESRQYKDSEDSEELMTKIKSDMVECFDKHFSKELAR